MISGLKITSVAVALCTCVQEAPCIENLAILISLFPLVFPVECQDIMNFGLHKRWEIFCLTEQLLLPSQDPLCCMQLVARQPTRVTSNGSRMAVKSYDIKLPVFCRLRVRTVLWA